MFYEAMQALTQQIIGSHQSRSASINSIRESARTHRQEFGKAHYTMAKQQRERLSQADGQRRAATQAHMKEFAQDHAKAHDAWHRMSVHLHAGMPGYPTGNGASAEQGTGPEHPSPRPSAHQARRSKAHPG